VDLAGRTFDKLTVLRRAYTGNGGEWLCRCECGEKCVRQGSDLLRDTAHACRGNKRCGLLRGEWVEGRTGREQAKVHARIGGGGSTVAPKGHAQ